MSRYRVMVTDQVFPDVDTERELLAEIDADLEVLDGEPDDVLAQARDADALLNTFMPIDAQGLAQLTRCRIVARYGIGVDNIDREAARQAGIVVTNVPDYCLEEVAVHALTLLLALNRRVPQGDRIVRAGGWGISELRPIGRVSELTVGLVGYGQIARKLGSALRALGAHVLAYDPYVAGDAKEAELVSFDELLHRSDAVSLHCPLTDETRGLIGRAELAAMPAHSLLINTSRGPLVVLDELLQALREGQIRGAGLDVLDKEPPPDPSVFEGVPGLLLTPHAAFYSESAVKESQHKAVTQVIKVLTGRQPDYRMN